MDVYPNSNDIGHNAPNIVPFVVGAVVGAGIALLLAPAHGRDTRRRVGSTVRRWSDSARQAMRPTRGRLSRRGARSTRAIADRRLAAPAAASVGNLEASSTSLVIELR